MKSELVERLEHLADLRVQSMVAAEKRAQEHAQRAKHYTEAETQYQRGLNDEMLSGPDCGKISKLADPSGRPGGNTEHVKGRLGSGKRMRKDQHSIPVNQVSSPRSPLLREGQCSTRPSQQVPGLTFKSSKGSERGETEPIRRNQIRTEERNQKGASPGEKGEH